MQDMNDCPRPNPHEAQRVGPQLTEVEMLRESWAQFMRINPVHMDMLPSPELPDSSDIARVQSEITREQGARNLTMPVEGEPGYFSVTKTRVYGFQGNPPTRQNVRSISHTFPSVSKFQLFEIETGEKLEQRLLEMDPLALVLGLGSSAPGRAQLRDRSDFDLLFLSEMVGQPETFVAYLHELRKLGERFRQDYDITPVYFTEERTESSFIDRVRETSQPDARRILPVHILWYRNVSDLFSLEGNRLAQNILASCRLLDSGPVVIGPDGKVVTDKALLERYIQEHDPLRAGVRERLSNKQEITEREPSIAVSARWDVERAVVEFVLNRGVLSDESRAFTLADRLHAVTRRIGPGLPKAELGDRFATWDRVRQSLGSVDDTLRVLDPLGSVRLLERFQAVTALRTSCDMVSEDELLKAATGWLECVHHICRKGDTSDETTRSFFSSILELNEKRRGAKQVAQSTTYAELGPRATVEQALAAVQASPDNAESHFHLGVLYLRLGETDLALAAFDEALRIDPVHFDSIRHSAQLCSEKGDDQRAIEFRERLRQIDDPRTDICIVNIDFIRFCNQSRFAECEQMLLEALKRHPQSSQMYMMLGNNAKMYGNRAETLAPYERARGYFERAVQLDPDAYYLRRDLAHMQIITDKLDDAIATLERSKRDGRAHPFLNHDLAFCMLLTADVDGAMRLMDEEMAKGSPRLATLSLHGCTAYAKGDFQKAISSLEKVMRMDPSRGENYYWLAAALQASGQSYASSEALGGTLRVLAHDRRAQRLAGWILLEVGNTEDAEYYLNLARKQDETDWAVHHGLGLCAAAQGNIAQAVISFSNAIQHSNGIYLDPFRSALTSLKNILPVDATLAILDSAISHSGRFAGTELKIVPPHRLWAKMKPTVKAACLLGESERRLQYMVRELLHVIEHLHEVHAESHAARSAKATHLSLRAEKASFLSNIGRADEGLEVADQIIVDAPEFSGGYSVRALALCRLGRPNEAKELFEKALAFDPTHVFNRSWLGMLQFELGEIEPAEKTLLAVLEDDPTNLISLNVLRQLYQGSKNVLAEVEVIKRTLRITSDPDVLRQLEERLRTCEDSLRDK